MAGRVLQVQVTVSAGTLAKGRNGAPETCRHVLQWQKVAWVMGLVVAQEMRPQLQEPRRGFRGAEWVGVESICKDLLVER